MNFEEEFDRTEKAAQDAIRTASRLAVAAKALAKAAKALAKAAADGDIARIRREAEKLSQEGESARHETANASAAWSLDPETEEQYLREGYAEELVRSADAAGLKMQRHDGAIVAYPLIIRVLPGQRAVKVERKKISALRPSNLVARLRAIQNRRLPGNPQAFLEALLAAYKLIAQGEHAGIEVPLAESFKIFTLLPGVDYSKEDFARDLLNLVRSGTCVTRSGARVSFHASGGTKDPRRTFFCVTPDGETVPFYAIKFTQNIQ